MTPLQIVISATANLSGVRTAEIAIGNFLSNLPGKILSVAEAWSRQVKAQIDAMEGIRKVSQMIGITAQSLSGLAYAADLADVSIGDLQLALKELNRWLAKNDQESKDTYEALLELADQFAAMPDGVSKTNLALERFGRSGMTLIPLLNQGGEALRAARKEAEEFGLVVGDEAVKATEDLNDNLKRIDAAFAGFNRQLAVALLPSLSSMVETMVAALKQGGFLSDTLKLIGEVAADTATALLVFGESAKAIFTGDWTKARGMVLEHAGAKLFGPASKQTGGDIRKSDLPETVSRRETLELLLDQERILYGLNDTDEDRISNLQRQLTLSRDILGAIKSTAQGAEFLANGEGVRYTEEGAKFAKEWTEATKRRLDIELQLGELQSGQSLVGSLHGEMETLLDRLGTQSQIIARSMSQAFTGAFQSIQGGIVGLIEGTGTWMDMLKNIRHVILNEVVGAIVQMFMRWIAMAILRSTTTTALAAAETAALAGPALMTSVTSFGVAALVGLAAFAAVTAAMGGFAAGGYTGDGDPRQVAGVAHRGEFVVPAGVVSSVGVRNLEQFVGDVRRSGGGGSAPLQPASGGGAAAGQQGLNLIMVDSRSEARSWAESSAGQARIVDIVRNHRFEIGIRT
jgi:hypothetical protein